MTGKCSINGVEKGLVMLTAVSMLSLNATAQTTFTWNGGGTTDNFSDTNNWNGANGNQHGILAFSGSTRLTPFADGSGTLNTHRLYFLEDAQSFVISGRILGLNDHGGADPTIRNLSTNVQTILNNIVGDSTVGTAASGDPLRIQANNGDIVLMGNITNRGSPMVISGGSASRYVALGGIITGNPNIEIDSAQLRILEGGNIDQVGGGVFVGNGGTTATAASLIIADSDGGTTINKNINVNGGNGTAFSRMVGANNTNGVNTFAGEIIRGASGNRDTTLAQTGGGTVDFDGAISGNHKVLIEGPGTVRFGGVNTYAANTEINSGQLHVKEGAVISAAGQTVYVGHGATPGVAAGLFIADLDGGTTVGHNIRINPGEDGNRFVGGLNTSGTNIFSGDIDMSGSGDRSATLSAEAGGVVAFTGVIHGDGGLTTTGDGVVELWEDNSYTGGTIVDGGTLRLRNSVGSATGSGDVIVRSGAALAGNGGLITSFLQVEDGGTMAPGNSIGDLSIDLGSGGEATFDAGAVFEIEIDFGLASDRIIFLGEGLVTFNNNVINFIDLTGGNLEFGTYSIFVFGDDIDVDGNLVIGTGLEQYEGSYLMNQGDGFILEIVPEPSSVLLIFVGVASLWVTRRRLRA
ncbi:MAG TPA: PEP-CTERM sorting domain-containing protein [Kiritimatiellia bacterium]|nr:PEP-CTERM sorting domain-containing protein [Kiritimatiellia bacterium]